jgi:hypothetical protein
MIIDPSEPRPRYDGRVQAKMIFEKLVRDNYQSHDPMRAILAILVDVLLNFVVVAAKARNSKLNMFSPQELLDKMYESVRDNIKEFRPGIEVFEEEIKKLGQKE